MTSPEHHFNENGYVVIPQAFSQCLVDELLTSLKKIKSSKFRPAYFSQATHRHIPFECDEFNFVSESILGFTRNKLLGRLAHFGESILLGHDMHFHLSQVLPQYSNFVQQNSMLFDRSMETVDHIDSWYLDTHPKGALVGAWVALEDIHPHSGPFHVYKGSHKAINPYQLQQFDHTDFIKHISTIKNSFPRHQLILSKGDLVLWHPNLIHGASKVINPKFSRKSITAHYLPLNAAPQTKNILAPIPLHLSLLRSFMQYPNIKKGHSIYQLNTRIFRILENLRYAQKSISFNLFEPKGSTITNDMRGTSYESS